MVLFFGLPFLCYTNPMSRRLPFLLLITAKGIIVVFAIIGFILVAGYVAVTLGLTNTQGIIDTQTKNFIAKDTTEEKYTVFPLAHTPEWTAFRQAVAKDLPTITRISKETGVSPRILIALLVPEQMRLFHSNRAIFKQFFEPLKMLGSQSQFSWGIFGIKDDTARAVESNLTNKNSPFYLGKAFENALSFTNLAEADQERFSRITNDDDRTYAYRYTALYVAQTQSAWRKAGYPIEGKPDIIATLWNLGFEKSKPHKNPASGGSSIEINGTEYSFGELAKLFYYSDEMIELFPIEASK